MRNLPNQALTALYTKCDLEISNFNYEAESKEYEACRFKLNGRQIICRDSKITPKKVGQFVTFWKRSKNGPIEPFEETDLFDYFVVNVRWKSRVGQFVFPKSILIKKGIISTNRKEGKRAFRVYPKWDIPKSKQAERTQNWQLDFFFEVTESLDSMKILEFYR